VALLSHVGWLFKAMTSNGTDAGTEIGADRLHIPVQRGARTAAHRVILSCVDAGGPARSARCASEGTLHQASFQGITPAQYF
jgi:hypothetical protein